MTHEILEYPSEIQLRLAAPTWPELLVEAGQALSARLWAGTVPHARGSRTWREVRLRAADRSALLVEWLNELLYMAESDWWIPMEFVFDAATDQVILARVGGVAVQDAPAAVREGTFQTLAVTPGPDGLEANVVLDV